MSKLPRFLGLFCNRALQKLGCFAEETSEFGEPTDRCYPKLYSRQEDISVRKMRRDTDVCIIGKLCGKYMFEASQSQVLCPSVSFCVCLYQDTATYCNTVQHIATHCNTVSFCACSCLSYCDRANLYGLCRSVSQCVAVCRSVSQCVAVSCSVLQCVAVCCSVLQCVAVCRSVSQ